MTRTYKNSSIRRAFRNWVVAAVLAVVPWIAAVETARADFWNVAPWFGEGYYAATATSEDGFVRFACSGNVIGDLRPDPVYPGLGPFDLALVFAYPALVENWADLQAATRTDLILSIDRVGYALPPISFRFIEEEGPRWVVYLSMADQMIADLLNGVEMMTLASTEGLLGVYPSDGDLSEGLQRALTSCLDQRRSLGEVLPAGLPPELARAANGDATGRGGATSPAGQTTEQRMRDHVASVCGTPVEIDGNRITTVELNGDGQPDTVLFWGGVTCVGAQRAMVYAAGNCGASHCLTSVFVSGTGRGPAPDDEFLSGEGPQIDPGRPGVLGFGVGMRSCEQAGLMPTCVAWMRWTGAGFERVN